MAVTRADTWIEPDDEIRFTRMTSKGGVVIHLGTVFSGSIDVFFPPDALPQLLQLANVCETAWSATLKPDAA